MHQASLPKLIAIVGPTASGKTDMALQLAVHFGGEIVCTDSRTMYRSMNIGTAKPTPEQQALIPHHLLDIATPDKTITLSDIQSYAYKAIDEIHRRNRLPFLVGGTALYTYAIIDTWHIPEVPPDAALRAELEQQSLDALWQQLIAQDPEALDYVNPKNKRRIIRALEVIQATGQPFSQQRSKQPARYDTLMLGLTVDRDTLRRNIAARTQTMLQAGLIEEVQTLLEKGYTPDLPALSGIHYREVIDYLQGASTKEKMIELINTHDYQLTRRQMTWYKRDARIHWVTTRDQATQLMRHFLDNKKPPKR